MKKLLSFAVIAAMSVGAYAGVCGDAAEVNCATVFKAKFSVKTTASGATKAVTRECSENPSVCYRKQGSRTYEGILYVCGCSCEEESLKAADSMTQIFWSKKGMNIAREDPETFTTKYFVTPPKGVTFSDGTIKKYVTSGYNVKSVYTNIMEAAYLWADPLTGATITFPEDATNAPRFVATNVVTTGKDGKPETNDIWEVYGPDGKLYHTYTGADPSKLPAWTWLPAATYTSDDGYVLTLPDGTKVTSKTSFDLVATEEKIGNGDGRTWCEEDVHILPGATLEFTLLNRIDKNGKKVEAVGTLSFEENGAFTLAGFGTYDTKNQIVKKISGYFAGTDNAPVCGCCLPAGYWGICEDVEDIEPATAAYGSWSISYDKSASKKIAALENGSEGGDLKLPSYVVDEMGVL